MIYNDFKDIKLSALGMGCMRLPVCDGDYTKIDMEKTRDMVKYAIDNGVNYFDTAWGYHSGNSELALGKTLKEYPRESFYLASKFPGYDLSNMDKVEQIFEAQLNKCQVEYFDFYLFHNVCEANIDAYLDKKYGIFDYLVEQKRKGRIRHLGFSTHGTLATMRRFLDAYGSEMEFCQIQLNWLDWKLQNAKAKVDMLRDYNLSIIVMEPVRGGSLATIDEVFENELRSMRPNASVVEWAFRFLQSVDRVVMTLSGMSNLEQLKENISTYEENKPLSNDELRMLLGVANKMMEKKTLPCTACRYCTSHCPMELDIPTIIELYNEYSYSDGKGFLVPMAIGSLDENKKPSACIGCRACEAVCPQNIKISEMMSDFSSKLKK